MTGRTAASVDFNGLIKSLTAGGGIDINTNTGGTVRFDGGYGPLDGWRHSVQCQQRCFERDRDRHRSGRG